VRYEGHDRPRPISTFEQAGLPSYLMATLREQGFERPTPIQCAAWPIALSGRDCIGLAKTGSGKTLAYALPSIVHVNAQPLLKAGDGPVVLVLAPTRELAVQIQAEYTKVRLRAPLSLSLPSLSFSSSLLLLPIPSWRHPCFAYLSHSTARRRM